MKDQVKRILLNRRATIANGLTVLRIVATPFIVFAMVRQQWYQVFFLFAVAALTDVLDGYLARRWNELTVLGTWLDPAADKFLLISSFGTLGFMQAKSTLLMVPVWFVGALFLRELILISGAFFLMLTGRKVIIQPTWWGKATTFFQIMLILWLLVCHFCGWRPLATYTAVLHGIMIFSYISLLQYILQGYELWQKKE